MHRNYMDSSCIQISIFDDRIEFQNPGGIFGDLSLEKVLAGYSSIRNTQIADIFQKMNIVEKWGTGLLRIADICKEAGTTPVQYQTGSGYFMATLLRKGTEKSKSDTTNVPVNDTINTVDDTINDTTNDTINDTINKLSDKEHLVFDSIKQQNSITAQEMAKQHNISVITVKRAINTLKTYGLIVRIGSNKKGFWSIKENLKER